MPTDTSTRSVTIAAPAAEVLATIRDVASQTVWVKEILEAEVLEANDDGTPRVARFAASTAVGTDRYTLGYEHEDAGMRWHLVDGRLQTGQVGVYSVRPVDPATTEVTFELTVSHNLPLPGFLRRRVIDGLVTSTVTGLQSYAEERA